MIPGAHGGLSLPSSRAALGSPSHSSNTRPGAPRPHMGAQPALAPVPITAHTTAVSILCSQCSPCWRFPISKGDNGCSCPANQHHVSGWGYSSDAHRCLPCPPCMCPRRGAVCREHWGLGADFPWPPGAFCAGVHLHAMQQPEAAAPGILEECVPPLWTCVALSRVDAQGRGGIDGSEGS